MIQDLKSQKWKRSFDKKYISFYPDLPFAQHDGIVAWIFHQILRPENQVKLAPNCPPKFVRKQKFVRKMVQVSCITSATILIHLTCF